MNDLSHAAWLFWASEMADPPPLAFIELLLGTMRSYPETPHLTAHCGHLAYARSLSDVRDAVFVDYRPVTLSEAAVLALKLAALQLDGYAPEDRPIREWGARS